MPIKSSWTEHLAKEVHLTLGKVAKRYGVKVSTLSFTKKNNGLLVGGFLT